MAPKVVQDAHDSLVELSQQCSEAHQLLYLKQGEEYPICLSVKSNKSFAAVKTLEPTKSGNDGVKKPLTTQNIPGLILANSDGIPEPKEPPVREFYHKIGRGLNGTGFDPHMGIFLLACAENPKIRIEDQVEMKGRWLRFPWKLFCGNFPVILQLLNKNYRSMKEGGEALVYDTYTTATPKLSYRGVGFNFMLFMDSEFAKNQSGCDHVQHFTTHKAFQALRSLGSRLMRGDSIEEKMNFSEKEEMIALARFLGMSEESIEEKTILSQRMSSKSVSVRKVARDSSGFISFDDPIESVAEEGKDITVPCKKAPENKFAGVANRFPHFKHLDKKRKFKE